MAKKVLIISTSLRGGSNSDILANKCAKGAKGIRTALGNLNRLISQFNQIAAEKTDVLCTEANTGRVFAAILCREKPSGKNLSIWQSESDEYKSETDCRDDCISVR